MLTGDRRIIDAIEQATGTRVKQMEPLSGGMICRAAKIVTDAGPLFAKWRQNAPEGFFAAEAHGLRLLREAGTLRVPEVIAVADDGHGAGVLVLEYVQSTDPQERARSAEALGRGLARLHRREPEPGGTFGLDRDNHLGLMPQQNAWLDAWPDFYRERRLLPQIELARKLGRLPPERERLVMRVVESLETLLDGLNSRPALLHGDLWAGNFMACDSEAVVCDPAVYYGEREMDIAYMELFGGFSEVVFSAYEETYPLDEGYAERRTLHQLYHLLNHLNHFGGSYGHDVDEACATLTR